MNRCVFEKKICGFWAFFQQIARNSTFLRFLTDVSHSSGHIPSTQPLRCVCSRGYKQAYMPQSAAGSLLWSSLTSHKTVTSLFNPYKTYFQLAAVIPPHTALFFVQTPNRFLGFGTGRRQQMLRHTPELLIGQWFGFQHFGYSLYSLPSNKCPAFFLPYLYILANDKPLYSLRCGVAFEGGSKQKYRLR